MISVEGLENLRTLFLSLPQATGASLRQAMGKVGEMYLAVHAQEKMHAPPPPHSSGRSPVSAGVLATRKGLLRAFKKAVKGRSLEDLEMRLSTRNYIARQHEFGETIIKPGNKSMTLPMPAAKDTRGRMSTRARRMLEKAKHVYQAELAGATLHRRTKSGKDRLVSDQLIALRRRRDRKVFLVLRKGRGSRDSAGKSRRDRLSDAFLGPRKAYEGKLEFWFHMVKSKQLKPRLDFRGLWRAWLPKHGWAVFRAALRDAIRTARRRTG